MVNMKNTALITGATSGLGLSYAKYFASAGYDLTSPAAAGKSYKKTRKYCKSGTT